jgi:uncharacterized protein
MVMIGFYMSKNLFKRERVMYDADKRKLLSALCHGAIFFSTTLVSVGVPIFIILVTDDPVVKQNAKESINFHINVWVYGFIIGLLITLSFGVLVPLAGIGYLLHWGLTIWALFYVLSDTQKPFRYPFIFRLV